MIDFKSNVCFMFFEMIRRTMFNIIWLSCEDAATYLQWHVCAWSLMTGFNYVLSMGQLDSPIHIEHIHYRVFPSLNSV